MDKDQNKKKHTLKDWIIATRPWSFSVSTIPVIATFGYLAVLNGGFAVLSIANFFLALLGIILFHCAGNLLSDWHDHRSGVDSEKAYAVPNLVFGHFKPKEYLIYGIVMLILGIVVGIILTLRSSWLLLVIGGIGALLTILYSFFKGKALGEAVIFTNFAILPMLGTSLVVLGAINFKTLVLSLPIGLITVAVLYINNLRDKHTDGDAGIRTFVMGISPKAAIISYIVLILLPLLFIVVSVATGILPWLTLIALIGIIPAIKIVKAARQFRTKGNDAILALDQQTAQLQMIFGLALSLGLFLSLLL